MHTTVIISLSQAAKYTDTNSIAITDSKFNLARSIKMEVISVYNWDTHTQSSWLDLLVPRCSLIGGSQDHFYHKEVFTVRIWGCSHFVKLKCIRKKLGPGKSVHYRGCSHFRGVHIPRFHCTTSLHVWLIWLAMCKHIYFTLWRSKSITKSINTRLILLDIRDIWQLKLYLNWYFTLWKHV